MRATWTGSERPMFLPNRLRGVVDRVGQRLDEARRPRSITVPSRWVRRPTIRPGDEVCLFVAFAPDGAFFEHSLAHARTWTAAGFTVVLVAVVNNLAAKIDVPGLNFAEGIMLRENKGYDFGAWSSAIQQLPELRQASLLVTANDSVYGPFKGFSQFLQLVRNSEADLIGTTESLEVTRHFQSFLLFYKPSVLTSRAFWSFWRSVRTGDREFVISRYELRLLRFFERSGVKCLALFPANSSGNPTLTFWKELLHEGFPYVKVELMRSNPFGADMTDWPDLFRQHGYDPQVVDRHQNKFRREC